MDLPTTILSNEHAHILKAIGLLTKECDRLEETKILRRDFFDKIIDFIKNYADSYHHAKEEKILFVEFCKHNEDAGFHCNPIEQMLLEHETGRGYVRGMLEGLSQENNEKIIFNGRKYAELLKDHIYKEDSILYPMVDRVFDQATQDEVSNKFKEVDNKRGDEEKKYLSMLENYG